MGKANDLAHDLNSGLRVYFPTTTKITPRGINDMASSIQSNINFQTFLFNPWMKPKQILLFWLRMDLRVFAIKWYSQFPGSPDLALYNQVEFSVISRILIVSGVLHLCRGYSLHIISLDDKG